MAMTTGFYGCCGADIIYLGANPYSKAEEQAVRLHIQKYKNSSKAFECVILSKRNRQYGFAPMLKELGFTHVMEGAGAHGDNQLMLLVRTREKGTSWDSLKDTGKRTWEGLAKAMTAKVTAPKEKATKRKAAA